MLVLYVETGMVCHNPSNMQGNAVLELCPHQEKLSGEHSLAHQTQQLGMWSRGHQNLYTH